MGVCDYSCFLCSDEGEQCLTNHEDCCDAQAYQYRQEDKIYAEEYNSSPFEEDKIYTEDDLFHEVECGYRSAHLYIFSFNSKPNDSIQVLAKIKNRDYLQMRKIESKYSWDSWNFEDVEGHMWNSPEIMYPDHFDYSIWQDTKGDWVLNICPTCAKFFIDQSGDNKNLCSIQLKQILDKHFKEQDITSKIRARQLITDFINELLTPGYSPSR